MSRLKSSEKYKRSVYKHKTAIRLTNNPQNNTPPNQNPTVSTNQQTLQDQSKTTLTTTLQSFFNPSQHLTQSFFKKPTTNKPLQQTPQSSFNNQQQTTQSFFKKPTTNKPLQQTPQSSFNNQQQTTQSFFKKPTTNKPSQQTPQSSSKNQQQTTPHNKLTKSHLKKKKTRLLTNPEEFPPNCFTIAFKSFVSVNENPAKTIIIPSNNSSSKFQSIFFSAV
eukprot:TRINITY_DN1281_c0_g1_i2.p1 TRINITY_DN1281_c0_g1~~TRINITY_DN1281_c0_g1_i2.p1  ORF type:complete len:220 (-),score=39.72 TRINITY_DN1281_c0_g1_i2:16-675(-)